MRKLLLCSLLLLGATGAMAQEFRFSAGYNASNVREAGDEHWIGRGGYQFGIDALLGNNRLFVKPGMHFLVRNLRYTYSNGTDVVAQDYTYTSRSLSVPVMLGARLIDPATDPKVNLYVMGGPTALISLSADLDNNSLDVKTNGTQWYLGFGAGVIAKFLFIEGGYNAAMSNVFKGDDFSKNPKVNYMYGIIGVRLVLAK
ncbi:MAG: PorT family protein [Flavobacteriales bacterium]|nr:PorT family protein [Flavobacteriales bacterium]